MLYDVHEEERGRKRRRTYFKPSGDSVPIEARPREVTYALRNSLISALKQAGYRLRDRFAMVVDTSTNYAPRDSHLDIYPAFTLDVLEFNGQFYLCMDHQLVIRAKLTLASLTRQDIGFQPEAVQRVAFRADSDWTGGELVELGRDESVLKLEAGGEILVSNRAIVPTLSRQQLVALAPKLGIDTRRLEEQTKRLSFLTSSGAALARLSSCTAFAERLARDIFPLIEGEISVQLEPKPVVLRPPAFVLGKDLVEPNVAFDRLDRTKRTRDILRGLVSFGAYEKPPTPLRLVMVVPENRAEAMDKLVTRLVHGANSYPGALRTFGASIVVQSRIVAEVRDYERHLAEFVRSKIRVETDVALVYLPKSGKTDDPAHPYFRVKRFLVKEGLASQMVDEATVRHPEWRDLNLALNIYAKAGYAPWVLDEAIPGADLFIGLSSSLTHHNGQRLRMMGYVNVFDSFGRWQFYQGDADAFPFEERLRHYGDLVRNSLAAYQARNRGARLERVHIHLTKQFSLDERSVLARAVRDIAPDAGVVFVWINPHHHLRLFDLRESAAGQISRTTYLRDGGRRLYLVTTGANVFKQGTMGTPVPLQLTVWTDPRELSFDLHEVGQQILSLTRLNWGSTRSFCHEPITTKFAGDIAYLMSKFLDNPDFTVNSQLRDTPWFL
jgi:hypothetical protein